MHSMVVSQSRNVGGRKWPLVASKLETAFLDQHLKEHLEFPPFNGKA